MSDPIVRLADLMARARCPVVFTGAGVSTESSIPDFRSPGGVWDRFDAGEMAYANFMSVEGRRRYWRFARAVYPVIRDAQPGAAHHAIAEFYRLHRLDCCITQNVDDLHRRAGLPAEAVIELHGNAARVRCLDCAAVYTRDEVRAWIAAGDDVPVCRLCGGIVKPTTVLFGEPMPARALAEAERRARAADLFVVVGSPLSVYPAAYIPLHAKHAGATLVIVNLATTPHDRRADLVIGGQAGDVMTALAVALRGAPR